MFEAEVEDGVALPILVVEVPPFVVVDGEALLFHGAAEEAAVEALERGAAGVIGVSAG